jgi:hypothetical protein
VITRTPLSCGFSWCTRTAYRVCRMGGPGRLKTPALLVFLVPLRRPGNLYSPEPA